MDRTPFYAEAGGQLGDHGRIATVDGGLFEVDDVQSPVPGLFVHRGRVLKGEVARGAAALGQVDVSRRMAISRAHTATHMIHRAFRELLGGTATQMGSENAPGRLRFDFPSPTPVPKSVLTDAEALVNEVLQEALVVSADFMSQQEALDLGAMALFLMEAGVKIFLPRQSILIVHQITAVAATAAIAVAEISDEPTPTIENEVDPGAFREAPDRIKSDI